MEGQENNSKEASAEVSGGEGLFGDWSDFLVEESTEEVEAETEDTPEPEENEKTSEETEEDAESEEVQEVQEESESEDEPEEETEEVKNEDEVDEADSSSFDSVLNSLVDDGALEIIDEDKEYTSDVEGLKELINDTLEKRLSEEKEKLNENERSEIKEIKEFLEAYPEATVADWVAEQDDFNYKDVDISDKRSQAELVYESLSNMGFEREEIIETIKKYDESNLLKTEAVKAQKQLIKEQEEVKQAKAETREAALRKQQAEQAEEVRQYEQNILKTNEIKGFKLSVEERQQLADYMLKPVDDSGRTQLQLDHTDDSDMLYALIHMKKLDLGQIERKATTKATIKFKKKLNKHTDTSAKPSKGKTNPKKDASEGDLSGLDSWNNFV